MSKCNFITLVVSALLLSACAYNPPLSHGLAPAYAAMVECRKVAETGSRIKSKTQCGDPPQGLVYIR